MTKYKVFLRIADAGSFTRAAEDFGYTQSAVSQMMRSLERELNVTLFTRTKHGIYLTSDGREMIEHARRLVNDYDAMMSKTTAINNLSGAIIRIGSFASVSANWLPSLIKSFKTKYPLVGFKLLQGDYATIRDWISDGTADLGFMTPEVAGDMPNTVLGTDEMVLVLPPEHELANKNRISLADIGDEPLIFLDEGKTSEPMSIFTRCGIVPNLQYHVHDDYTIMNMVEQGLGVSILPKLVLTRHGRNIAVRSLDPPIFRTICVACRDMDTMSIAGRYFTEHIIDGMRDHDNGKLI